MERKDLSDMRFGFLVAKECVGSNAKGHAIWKCLCDCGAEKNILGNALLTGHTKSCGASIHRQRHGDCGKRLNFIWSNMISRCNNPNYNNYDRYGGRGITVCEEWKNSYENFREWALSHGYADNLTIDRIDNDGNYEPSNCRWATKREQGNNRSSCLFFTIGTQTLTLMQWCKLVGISYTTVSSRLKRGWCIEDALLVPVKSKFAPHRH